MKRQIEPAEFRLGTGGHTSAVQVAMEYIRAHNAGKDALQVPEWVLVELEKLDGPAGPTEIRIEADLFASGILATQGTQVLFWALCPHLDELPTDADIWRIDYPAE